MKFALFDFVDEGSCEIGESSWIVGEDPKLLDNDKWISNKIIVVKWPKDYKRLMKSSTDINSVEGKSYAAMVIKFSGK